MKQVRFFVMTWLKIALDKIFIGDNTSAFLLGALRLFYSHLSHDVAFGSDIMPCNKIDKPLVVYRFHITFY